jgi:hypothetical protein
VFANMNHQHDTGPGDDDDDDTSNDDSGHPEDAEDDEHENTRAICILHDSTAYGRLNYQIHSVYRTLPWHVEINPLTSSKARLPD